MQPQDPDLLAGPGEEPAGSPTRLAARVAAVGARWRRLPGAVRTGSLAAVLLAVVAGGLVAAPDPDPAELAGRPASPTPGASRRPGLAVVPPGSLLTRPVRDLVVAGDAGTGVLRTLQDARPTALLPVPLREGRQHGGLVVGLRGATLGAVLPSGRAVPGPPADRWFPGATGGSVWAVRGNDRRGPTSVRRVPTTPEGFGPPGTVSALPARVRAVGEWEGGLLVVERTSGGAGTRARTDVLLWDPGRAAPVRLLARDAGASDVRAGTVLWRSDPCPDPGRCPLQVTTAAGTTALAGTADREHPLRPASGRLDERGRHVAYTRQLARETGDPRATSAEVVVVHVGGGRLAVVPASQGTRYEQELTWAGDLLLFVRRLQGPVVAVYAHREDRVAYGPPLPTLGAVEAVLGLLGADVAAPRS